MSITTEIFDEIFSNKFNSNKIEKNEDFLMEVRFDESEAGVAFWKKNSLGFRYSNAICYGSVIKIWGTKQERKNWREQLFSCPAFAKHINSITFK